MLRSSSRFAALLLSAAFAFMVPAAVASDHTYHEESSNAIGPCEGALPAYESRLRQRPLAVVNESATNSFVNCALAAPSNSKGREWFAVRVDNMSGATRNVNCTGVIGVEGNVDYYVQGQSVPPGQSRWFKWTKEEHNGGERIQTNTGFQCNLPSWFSVTEIRQGFWSR